jgi:hypothetical protein
MPALPPDLPGCRKTPCERRPLPDPAAIRLYLVPDSAPPYDSNVPGEELETRRLPVWAPPAGTPGTGEPGHREPGQETGYRDSPGRDSPGQDSPGQDSLGGDEGGRDGGLAGDGQREVPRRPATALDGPAGWPDRFAQVLAETLAGSRPPRQLAPWTTRQALDRIGRLGPRFASAQRPRVRRVITSLPAPDVLEMSVVVVLGPRVIALAVRLERSGSPAGDKRRSARWVCTAVEAA